MNRIRLFQFRWLLPLLVVFSHAVTLARDDMNSKAISLKISEVMQKGDIGLLIDWIDAGNGSRNPEDWIAFLKSNNNENEIQRNILFAIFSRSCLFSPRDVARFLNRFDEFSKLLGGVDVTNLTRSVGTPHWRRYMSGSGIIIGIDLKQQKGDTLELPAIVYVGINRNDFQPGDELKAEDIDFVDTQFELLIGLSKKRIIEAFDNAKKGATTNSARKPEK